MEREKVIPHRTSFVCPRVAHIVAGSCMCDLSHFFIVPGLHVNDAAADGNELNGIHKQNNSAIGERGAEEPCVVIT